LAATRSPDEASAVLAGPLDGALQRCARSLGQRQPPPPTRQDGSGRCLEKASLAPMALETELARSFRPLRRKPARQAVVLPRHIAGRRGRSANKQFRQAPLRAATAAAGFAALSPRCRWR